METTMKQFNGVMVGSLVIFGVLLVVTIIVMVVAFRRMNGIFQRGQRIGDIFERRLNEAGQSNSAPRLTVEAKVLSKRQQIFNGFTYYYVTFEKDGGERFELQASGELVGLMCEGDYGTVTVQGTHCVQFDRR